MYDLVVFYQCSHYNMYTCPGVSAGQDGQAEEEGGGRRGAGPPAEEGREAPRRALQGEEEESGHRQGLHQHLHRPLRLQPGVVLLCALHALQSGQTGRHPAPVAPRPGPEQHQRPGRPGEVLGVLPAPGLLWDEDQKS